jgi:F-type H+-transporting ATPase subunit b
MAAAEGTIEGTVAPEGHSGLPQMDVQTFTGQIFWLVLTFGLLFLVLSRMTLPMIAGAIGARRSKIEGDLSTAEGFRKDAADALASYETALTQARTRAHQLADENKKRIVGEIERLKTAAESEAQTAMGEAEKRIAGERARAVSGVKSSAAEAAAEIVQRLIGREVSIQDATAAVASVEEKGR